MSGYYKCCNACGGGFGGPAGARRYIWHLRETPCGTYYGHQATGEPFESWLWHTTGQERAYLSSLSGGPP